MDETDTRNIAQTLADILPEAQVIERTEDIIHFAVPNGYKLEHYSTEPLGAHPKRARSIARFTDVASFLAYVKRHESGATVAWAEFNPQTFALAFTTVLDDHAPQQPGWRQHVAQLAPDLSAEWKAWKGKNGVMFTQMDFAEWLEAHSDDIAQANGLPTALQMLEMATNFVANEERSLKSAIRLQSGGVRLSYIADADSGTTAAMDIFAKFGLGIPVFHGGHAWSMTARLKYRNNGGKLAFHYELVRPDRVHQGAAEELITQVRDGLGDVPLLMGQCA